jgi:hypothetical protein
MLCIFSLSILLRCSDISILHHLDCDLKIFIYDMIGNISDCFLKVNFIWKFIKIIFFYFLKFFNIKQNSIKI